MPFAAGAMLAVAFFDLLPEALATSQSATRTMSIVLGGFVLFFVLERFLGWFHHHHEHNDSHQGKSVGSLVVVGDILHNAIDGMVIGGAFLADPMLGVVTTIAIAAHEVPQEIGDFGVMLALGMRRRTVLTINIVSALTTVVVAAIVFGSGGVFAAIEPFMLALTAGMFLYIAASDLVPTIHNESSPRVANYQTMIFVVGIILIGTFSQLVHRMVPESDAHSVVRVIG